MKTYVSFSKPDVSTNPLTGITTVDLAVKVNLLKMFGTKAIGHIMSMDEVQTVLNKYEFDKATFEVFFGVSGTSTCNKEDKFDEPLGYRIASTRAQRKAHTLTCNLISEISNAIEKELNINKVDHVWCSNGDVIMQTYTHEDKLINNHFKTNKNE